MERVLVFKEEELNNFSKELFIDHISTTEEDITTSLVECLDNSFFVLRAEAEKDASIKQIIPYAVIESEGKYLVYRRTKHGGEGRLYDLYSIGVGGHINPSDAIDDNPGTALSIALSRELEEELAWPGDPNIDTNVVGVIYDSTNDVGKVHFGIVIKCTVNGIKPIENETSLADLNWYTKEELLKLENLENWSKFVIKTL